MAQAEQYFAAEPQSKDVRKTLHVTLRGNEADVEVSNGVFSGNRVDLGTSVLLRQAPEPPEEGTFLDAATADGIPAETTFDLIWSNPPIRVGKEVLHTLLMTWLPRLNAGGAAYLVVQKNLGSDSLIPWLATQLGDGYEVSKYASSKGFRVIEVMKA